VRRHYIVIVATLLAWVAVVAYKTGRASAYDATYAQAIAWRDVEAFINAQADSIYALEQAIETVRCASVP
jgi:hypothetical protein